MVKLNLGCGKNIIEGYINMDITDVEGINVVWDADKLPYPFKDNYLDEIFAKNSIEHLSVDTDLLMKELHRILKPGGRIKIRVPHYTNPSTYFTQHKKVFSSRSFDGYIKSNYDYHYDFCFKEIDKKIDFVRGISSIYNVIIEKIANKNIERYYESTPLSLFPAKGLWFTLVK